MKANSLLSLLYGGNWVDGQPFEDCRFTINKLTNQIECSLSIGFDENGFALERCPFVPYCNFLKQVNDLWDKYCKSFYARMEIRG